MQPLYAAQPDQSARIADRKWLDNECLDGGCQSLKWHERIAALEREVEELCKPLTDDELLAAIHSLGADAHGRVALTYEHGPYDIDACTVIARRLADSICAARSKT